MSETREVRAYLPAAVAERLEQAAEVLGQSIRKLAGECLEAGMEQVVCDKARHRAAELAAFLPPHATRTEEETAAVTDSVNGQAPAADVNFDTSVTENPVGRGFTKYEREAEELRQKRLRQRSAAKAGRDPVN